MLMPGVPHEMKAMWEESVRPLLLAAELHPAFHHAAGAGRRKRYRIPCAASAGRRKSHRRNLLQDRRVRDPHYCPGRNRQFSRKMCRAYATKFYDLLGDAVYDEGCDRSGRDSGAHPEEKGLTIATAESCTGGMIAQRLTNVSGASEVFGFGFVTYWEQAKAKMIGVDPAAIAKYNVVSAPVAAQMALGASEATGADIAVSVTGLAGPNGGDAVRPVGTVYLGAACGGAVYVKSSSSPAPTVRWCVPARHGTGTGAASGSGQSSCRYTGTGKKRPA